MKTDYKYWYIRRDDDVHISECAVRFFEGDVTTENEFDKLEGNRPVARFRRTKRLSKVEMPHFEEKKVKIEKGGSETIIFTDKDFGKISTDEELNAFIDTQIAKDADREVYKI